MTTGSRNYSNDDIARRVLSIEGTVVPHNTHVRAVEALEGCMDRAGFSTGDRRLPARGQLMYGKSGAGKTTAIEAFEKRYLPPAGSDRQIRPIIKAEIPVPTTQRALVQAIFEALGYKSHAADSANAIIYHICDKVARRGVKMIILDEGQGAVSGKAIFAISEFLKSLLNRIGCQIVIAGCPELVAVHSHAQLHRRLLPDIALDPYDWNTPQGQFEFKFLLNELEENMLMPEPSGLSESDVAKRIYVASDACTGTISNYLSMAVTVATRRGLTRIDKHLLAEIYASFNQVKASTTPDFEKDYELDEYSDSEEYIEAFLQRLEGQVIDPATNPFVCESMKVLTEIWLSRQKAAAEAAQQNLKARGTGRQLAPIFRI